MDCRSSIGTAKTITSLWIEHPQRSPLRGSSACLVGRGICFRFSHSKHTRSVRKLCTPVRVERNSPVK